MQTRRINYGDTEGTQRIQDDLSLQICHLSLAISEMTKFEMTNDQWQILCLRVLRGSVVYFFAASVR